MMQHDFSEAIPHLVTALNMTPDSLRAHYSLGVVFVETGELDLALEEFATVLRQIPDHAAAMNGVGAVLLRKRMLAEAVPFFERALELLPDYQTARINLEKARRGLKSLSPEILETPSESPAENPEASR